ncbi:flavin reductase family protein [Allorhizocola rhizosphaerae]|uniref:flavin reductase family protein n=1 Tax=Allorhizocola rhizosphaerae TaxID=1872709 RepID=UPI000E3B702A|nr:flavin reductase family protein [Allorhizocola rhizosphaerae]
MSTLAPIQPDAATFRAAMACFPTGVALLTQGCGPDTSVMTLNSFTSVSLQPLLILVSVRSGGKLRDLVWRRRSFGVNILAADQRDLSVEFARSDRPTGEAAMARLGAVEGITGNAVIPSAVASIECKLHAEYPGGDHTLLLGRVVAIHSEDPDRAPLLYHRSRYASLV